MKNETFRTTHQGDRPSAKEYNRLKNVATEEAAIAPTYGQQEIDIGGVRGEAKAPQHIQMVRIQSIIVPEWEEELFADAQDRRTDATGETGQRAYNAIVQVWDDDEKAWADDPDRRQVDVVVLDDREGWRPLVKNEVIAVVWKKVIGKYVPLETKEAALVMLTSSLPDSEGFYPGLIIGYDSFAKAWVNKGECYVIDVGS